MVIDRHAHCAFLGQFDHHITHVAGIDRRAAGKQGKIQIKQLEPFGPIYLRSASNNP